MEKMKHSHTDVKGHKWSFYKAQLHERQNGIVALSIPSLGVFFCTDDVLSDDERIYNLKKKIDR